MGAPKKPTTKKIENSDIDPEDDEFEPKVKKKAVDEDDDFDGPLDDDLGRGYDSFDDDDDDDY